MADAKRERAIQLVYSLTTMVRHPNTPKHEAAAAQARIDHLRTKYKLAPSPEDELKRQADKTQEANREWERRAEQQRQQQRAERMFWEQAEADNRSREQRQRDANRSRGQQRRWSDTDKYQATIMFAEEGTSSNGNPMVTVTFRVEGHLFKAWYVLNNEYGVRKLMALLTDMIGPQAPTWPLDQALFSLRGMTCRVMLAEWDRGWKVDQVLKPWA